MEDIKTALEIAAMVIGAILWTFATLWKASTYVKKQIEDSDKIIKKLINDKAEATEQLRHQRSVTYEQAFETHKNEVKRFITRMMDFEDTVDDFERRVALQINDLENKVQTNKENISKGG